MIAIKVLLDKKHASLLILLKDKSIDASATKQFFTVARFYKDLHILYYFFLMLLAQLLVMM